MASAAVCARVSAVGGVDPGISSSRGLERDGRTPAFASGLPERRTPVVLHFFRNELRHMDLRPLLSAITAPTLVMGGGQDPITPPGCAAELVEAIGDIARLAMFPDCGHGAYRDDPAGAEQVLRAFLAG